MALGNFIQIAIWAALFLLLGGFADFATAAYHYGVNLTSPGYGDIVMSEGWRMLGPNRGSQRNPHVGRFHGTDNRFGDRNPQGRKDSTAREGEPLIKRAPLDASIGGLPPGLANGRVLRSPQLRVFPDIRSRGDTLTFGIQGGPHA